MDSKTVQAVVCRRCGGTGEVWERGTSLSPFTGLRGYDPQYDESHECPRCHGDGQENR